MRRPLPLAVLAAAAALPLLSQPAYGQPAREVLETAMERYEQRMEGVENYTVVQTIGGTETTLYYELVESEATLPRFRQVTLGDYLGATAGGEDGEATIPGGEEAALGATDPYRMFDEMAARAELRGTESVDGRMAHVIVVDDMSGVDLGRAEEGGGDGTAFEPRSATMWIDAERYVLLRSSMTGLLEAEGDASEVTAETRMSDYREVDGVLHPFRTEVAIEGLGGAMSAEDREELRRAHEQMERQLEGMSEQQRAMVEKMMKDRMPDLEALAGGTMEMTMEVRELRVNEGPPESMRAAADRRDEVSEARQRRAAEREEEQQRRRRQEARRVREEAPVDPSDHEMQYPRYAGLYDSTGEEEMTLFVTERCGSGALAIGAMRGDVAPWVFEEVDEDEFRAPPISPGGREMHVRFADGPDAEVAFEILSEGWEGFGRFRRAGDLPDGWERCMQPRR